MAIPVIVFQGRPGAYSQSAAWHLFGCEIETRPCDTFEQMFQAVEDGSAEGAVVPIENSTAGSIHENYDNLLRFRLPIVSEVKLQVQHSLLATPGTRIADLREVHSHPQALAQCSGFFAAHPHIKRVAAFDTAGSAEIIAAENPAGRGAIASEWAAKLYGLEVLRTPLENTPSINFTRFFGIRKKAAPTTAAVHGKTSLVFAPNLVGTGVLHHALGCFANEGINLVRIESRPKVGSPWEYVFYLDFEGHPDEPPAARALERLRSEAAFLHILGSYVPGTNKGLDYSPSHG